MFSARKLLFLVFALLGRLFDDLLRDIAGDLFVMAVLHREGAASRGHGAEDYRVAEHLGKRALGLDYLEFALAVDAHDASAAAVEVAHDVSEAVLWDGDFDVHHRLHEDRVRLLHAFLEGDGGRDLEGHFRRVHIMV
ncbi:hypothetical protein SDC9_157832 [bioreactor metagenome]|uniref:Uncharacterized protein n=1 Tax=bioreactor metagenome TaxID=1076179 RepID=A0A645F8I0_9ZZZZ